MTVHLRDASNFDAAIDFAGLAGLTHKATEGTTVVHDRCGPRLTAARDFGVPVLGAYHVVRTPGSGGNGSLASQLSFWFRYLDAKTPWWRQHPHFILQIDAERWTYDDVQPGIVLQFAGMLVAAGVPGWKITYASRGQYGDSLRGIATPLWNADYRGSAGGSYPGDNWTSSGGRPAGWAPYSGQKPVLLQYTSTPYDRDAYAGTLDELLALVADGNPNGATAMTTTDDRIRNLYEANLSDPANEIPRILRVILGMGPEDLFPMTADGHIDGSKLPGLRQVMAALNAPVEVAGALTDAQIAELGTQLGQVLVRPIADLTAAVQALTARLAAAGHALEG